MSFPKKTWKNRISDEPSRRLLTPTNGGDAYTVDVTRAEGTITQEGDAFNATNMNDLENRIEAAIGGGTDLLAPTEATSTASKPYSVNEYVIYDNKYYRVTAAIPQGGSLVPGTNITEDPVGTALTRIIGVNNTQNTNITNLGRQLRSAGASGTDFYFDQKDGKYGWNSSAARGADTFHPFRGDSSDATSQIFSQTYDSDNCPSSITFSNLTRIDAVTAINIESTNCRVGISWMGISGNTLNLGYQVTYSGTVTLTITCKQYHTFDE